MTTLALSATTAGRAWAVDPYPSRPIQFVVPFAAGGGTDLVARPVAQGMADALKQPVVVLNKPGAAGNIGTQFVARSAPDGYTLVFGSTGTHTVNDKLYDKPGFDPVKDFVPVSLTCEHVNVLGVSPSFPARTLEEFVQLVKANPGKYFYAVTQSGSSGHLAMELFKHTAGLDLPSVPYRGAAAVMTDFLGGQISVLMDTVTFQQEFIRTGKVRALAVTSAQRVASLAEVPTIAERGYPGFRAVGWNGVLAPAHTPAAIIKTLNQAVQQAIDSPAYKTLGDKGLVVKGSSSDEMARYIRAEGDKWAKVIAQAGIKAE